MPAFAEGPEECFGALATDLGRDLGADRLFIACQEADREPLYLFQSGDCTDAERDLLSAAVEAAGDGGADPVFWSRPDIEADGTSVVTGCISSDRSLFTVSAVFRRLHGSKREAVRHAVVRFLPVLRTFCRLWTRGERALASNHGMVAALNGSDVATILVDADGMPVFANDAAERLLDRRDGLSRVGRKLAGRRLSDTVRPQAAIEYVVHGVECAQDATPVVALGRAAGRSSLAAVVSAGAHSPEPGQVAAIVHVYDPARSLNDHLEPVCRLYGLTVVETRLALLLAEGRSLAEAARISRIQDQTARSYLMQMFVRWT